MIKTDHQISSRNDVMKPKVATKPARVSAAILGALLVFLGITMGSTASASAATATDFTYKYYYVLSYPPQPGPQAVARMAERNFSAYFPFSGCGKSIYLGETCYLGEGLGGHNPIHVLDVSPTSFTFLSLPGHFEGPNRFITFSFYTDSFTNRLYLAVWSRGPISPGSVGSVISGVANGFWKEYATNLAGGIARGDYRHY
jgi:hypothetical protein